jgi:hypothetical protein
MFSGIVYARWRGCPLMHQHKKEKTEKEKTL